MTLTQATQDGHKTERYSSQAPVCIAACEYVFTNDMTKTNQTEK